MTTIICIAGFGDNATMFDPLVAAATGSEVQYHPINLPGFGAPALGAHKTSLEAMASYVMYCAKDLGAEIVLAHSVASIIATIAAQKPHSPVTSIMSLEGNLTREDAYFSGTAARYGSADQFRTAFLNRLEENAKDDPLIERYRGVVACADGQALWELGCDADRFSAEHSPGRLLQTVPRAAYFFNPRNIPESSLLWLESNELPKFELPEASHWASIDKPHLLCRKINEALEKWKDPGFLIKSS
ncbi:MAG: hypothetical protein AAF668_09810 [Pseudomonadota bacterium]